MPIDKTKLTNAMLIKAAKCETAEELIALAKANGIEITKDEAEAYLAELDKVAGGYCLTDSIDPDCIEKGMFHP